MDLRLAPRPLLGGPGSRGEMQDCAGGLDCNLILGTVADPHLGPSVHNQGMAGVRFDRPQQRHQVVDLDIGCRMPSGAGH